MIKKLLTIFLITVICICSSISASAYTEQYIFDYEGSLSYSEIEELESIAQQIENEYGCCVMFCIKGDDGLKHVPVDISFTAAGIINIPTEQEILETIQEMREKPLKTA